jgi:MFS family permease
MSASSNQPARQAGPRQGFIIQIVSSLTIMGAVMVAPMLPKLGAEFGSTSPQAAELVPLIATGPALAIALFAPIAGFLADRFGRKAMLIVGCLIYALVGFLPAVLSDLNAILAARLVFGCAEAIIMTCCATLIADYWVGHERAKYINRQVVTIGIVGAVFFVIGGIVGETSWRHPFYLYLLPLLFVPAIVTVLWEPSRRTEQETGSFSFPGSEVLRTTIASCFLVFIGMVAIFIVPVMAPGILVALGVTSSSLIGLATGLGLSATLAGSISWPFVRNRLGVAGVNALLLTIIALGLWLLTRATDYTSVLIAVGIHGFGAGFLVPNAMLPLLSKLPPKYRARGVGVFTSCLYLGQFASPIVVTNIAQHFGGVPQGIASAIGLWAGVLVALAILWVIVRLILPDLEKPVVAS